MPSPEDEPHIRQLRDRKPPFAAKVESYVLTPAEARFVRHLVATTNFGGLSQKDRKLYDSILAKIPHPE